MLFDPDARAVIINDTQDAFPSLWRTLLSPTARFKTLDVFEENQNTVEPFEALRPGPGAEGVPCPELQTVNWTSGSAREDPIFELMAVANDRARRGSPLRELSIWSNGSGDGRRTVEFDALGAPMGYFNTDSSTQQWIDEAIQGLIDATTAKHPDGSQW